MIPTAKHRLTLAAACLAALALPVPTMAETRDTVHNITKAAFISNCNEMAGEVVDAGGDEAGCNLQSGTSVVCTFEPANSDHPGGVCEVATRVARADLRHLLGGGGQTMTTGQVPESLTSSGSESSPGVVGGTSGGGKGVYVGGAGAGASSMGDGGPAID